MPASKVDRQSYPNEPARATQAAPAPKGAAGKDTSPFSAIAPQLVSLRNSSLAATGAAQAKPSAVGNVPERFRSPDAIDRRDGVLEEASMQTRQSASMSTANLGQQDGPAKVAVGHASNNSCDQESERSGAFSIAAFNAGTENTVELLLNRVAALEFRAESLAGRLGEAGRQLESGDIPAHTLTSDLAVFQADMKTLQGETVEVAKSLSVPADAATVPTDAFHGLRAVLASVLEAHQHDVFRHLHGQAARELENAVAIEARGGSDLAPLDESRSAAQRLLAEVRGAQWPNAHPECLALVEGRHPYSRLLDLVRDGESLNDTEWETAQEAVATAFGRPLAIAAVRGRLMVRSGPAASVQAVSYCPACKAELEPGAKFCGDCGVKIE
jgi:hypothetical protein